ANNQLVIQVESPPQFTNTLPSPVAINENGQTPTSFTFHSPGTGVSVSDIDTGSEIATISVTNGTATLGTTAGLTFTVGNGTNNNGMTFSGTIAQINAALNGMVFTPTLYFSGLASLTVTVTIPGATNNNGTLQGSTTATFNVAPINQAPVINLTGSLPPVLENQSLVFSPANNDVLTVTDVDGAGQT